MNRSLLLVGAIVISGGCAVGHQTSESGDKAAAAEPNDKARRPAPIDGTGNKVIEPSPWQPPAEVDPVPPPVEGGEPKRPQ